MSVIKKVVLAGASGNLGPAILKALIQSNLFKVTVITRKGSAHSFPPNITVKTVDYESVSSLETALKGQDALISALAFEAIHIQKNLVDAAFNAGIQRMIPSEYGNDTQNPKLATMPIYQPKIAIREYLDEKVAQRPSFSYTIIMNSSFLAPGFALDFILDVKNKQCDLKDGGDALFSAATLDTIAQAAVQILTHLDETVNRAVKIKDIDTTQNELVRMAQKIDPTGVWKITHSRTEDLEREARESWARGDRSEEVVNKFIYRAFLGKGYGGHFPKTDNELLGIKGLDRTGLEDIVRAAMTAQG